MKMTISHPTGILNGVVQLPGSKSESNRLLILQHLSKGLINVQDLSDARDTRIMQAALQSDQKEINIGDAGTAMRFLTAYYCAIGQSKILTGSERMCERPIGILVDALRDLGFDVKYLKDEGYPPIEIIPCENSYIQKEVEIAGNVSSQYISALLLIAPVLPNGLTIKFNTAITSRPYIELTLSLLHKCGIDHKWEDDMLQIAASQSFQEIILSPSRDWSSASYWYSMATLSVSSSILLQGLSFDTAQGDQKIAGWTKLLGVESKQEESGIRLIKTSVNKHREAIHFDFSDHPDLAQTVIVLCAAMNIPATFNGLQSLRIKETDRVLALQQELIKFGIRLFEFEPDVFRLEGKIEVLGQVVETYNDHRMAMAFAPLALLGEITIENPNTTSKSYPAFWEEMKSMGFSCQESS